jgi:hypothetical protein
MILGDSKVPTPQQLQGQRRVTIDEVFRRIASKHPDKLALADAPNRKTFTDGAPRRLTYAEADRMVSAIAGRLRRMGMTTDDIVGIQLPNVAENIRCALTVAVAPRRRAGRVRAHRRQGTDHLRTRWWLQSQRIRHAGRFRNILDPLRLRLWAEAARWRGAVR